MRNKMLILSSALTILLLALFPSCSSEKTAQQDVKIYNTERVTGPSATYRTDPDTDAGYVEVEFPHIAETKEEEDADGGDAEITGWRVYFRHLEVHITKNPPEIFIVPPGGDVVFIDRLASEMMVNEFGGELTEFTDVYRYENSIIAKGKGATSGENWRLSFAAKDNYSLKVTVTVTPERYARKLTTSFRLTDGEAIYGFGELFDAVNTRGTKIKFHLALGDDPKTGTNERYAALPFFISTRRYAVLADTMKRGIADSESDPKSLSMTFYNTGEATFNFFFSQTPKELLKYFSSYVGAPKLPPIWTFSPYIIFDSPKSPNKIIELLDGLRSQGIPGSSIIIKQWSEPENNFEPNKEIFGDISSFVQDVNKQGYAVQLCGSPMVASPQTEPPATPTPNASETLFEEGAENGYFALDKKGEVALFVSDDGGKKALVDLTNENAFDWWKGKIKTLLEKGIEGFCLDPNSLFAETYPAYEKGIYFSNGESDAMMQSYYKVLHQKVYRETMDEFFGNETASFSLLVREGGINSRIYPSALISDGFFGNFDNNYGLPSAVRGAITASLSGFHYYGAASGKEWGAHKLTTEALARWAQFSALSPIMALKIEEDLSPFASGDEEANEIYRLYANIHTELFPYFYTLAKGSIETGIPIIRALYIEYPEDKEARDIDSEFMLGKSLLIAPILSQGDENKCRDKANKRDCYYVERDIYFPQGDWFNWFTGEKVVGGKSKKVGAYLSEMPIYAVGGAIIPLLPVPSDTLFQPQISNVPYEDGSLNKLAYKIFPSKDNSSILYDNTSLELKVAEDIELSLTNAPDERRTVLILLLNSLSGFQFDEATSDGKKITESQTYTELLDETDETLYFYDKDKNIIYIGVSGVAAKIMVKSL
ncbi:MAG: hypothetical protein Kow0090_17590 [Myxococcota bacterium]